MKLKHLFFYSAALFFVAFSLLSCGEKNEEVKPDPTTPNPEPTKIDSFRYEIRTVKYLEDNISQMEAYAKENDPKNYYRHQFVIFSNALGFSKDQYGLIPRVYGIKNARNTKQFDDKNFTLYAIEDMYELSYNDWTTVLQKRPLFPGPNGERWGIRPQEKYLFENDKDVYGNPVNMEATGIILPGGTALITIETPDQVKDLAGQVKAYLDLGYPKVFVDMKPDFPLNNSNMFIADSIAAVNKDGKIIDWIGNGGFYPEKDRVPADGAILSKLKVKENKENPGSLFYIIRNADKVKNLGYRVHTSAMDGDKMEENSGLIPDSILINGNYIFNAKTITNFKGINKIIPMIVSTGKTLEMENVTVQALGNMITKSMVDFYRLGDGFIPDRDDLFDLRHYDFVEKTPIRLVDANGKILNPRIQSFHIANGDSIYECGYETAVGNKMVDISNRAFQPLICSYKNYGVPKITTDGQNIIVVPNNFIFLSKSDMKPNSEWICTTGFLSELSAMFDAVKNEYFILLNVNRVWIAYRPGEEQWFGQQQMQPMSQDPWLKQHNFKRSPADRAIPCAPFETLYGTGRPMRTGLNSYECSHWPRPWVGGNTPAAPNGAPAATAKSYVMRNSAIKTP